jgi:hypothetical protein
MAITATTTAAVGRVVIVANAITAFLIRFPVIFRAVVKALECWRFSSPTFGVISYTAVTPRIGQLALRLEF